MLYLITELMLSSCIFVSKQIYNVGYYFVYKEQPYSTTERLLLLQNKRINDLSNEIIEIRKLLR